VSNIAKIIEQMRRSPQNVRFDDLAKVCADHFGEPRQEGTSHKVYKTPWQGDPRVNIQRGKDGNAKAYQVRQVLAAIARLEAEKTRRVTTMPDATHYTYRVAWSVEDGEHVATVAEFPSLSWLAATPVEALAGLADVVRDVLADLAASGESIPEPLSERTYSGRFVVRVPAEVHRRLVREAAEQHVSLNRLVSDRLARA
jgi:predicted RNase H-like HicB family nuclease